LLDVVIAGHFGMQRLHIHWRRRLARRRIGSDYARCAFQKPTPPVRDLAGVDIKKLRQLCQRLLPTSPPPTPPSP
jgi:hypothetical protein